MLVMFLGKPARPHAANRRALRLAGCRMGQLELRLPASRYLGLSLLLVLTDAAPAHSLQEVEQQLFKREPFFESLAKHAPDFLLRDAAGQPLHPHPKTVG